MGLADLCLIQSCELIKMTYWIKKNTKIKLMDSYPHGIQIQCLIA